MVKWFLICVVFFIVNVNAVEFDELYTKALMRLISIYEKEKNPNEIVFWTKKRDDADYKKQFIEAMLRSDIILMMEHVSELDNLTAFTDSKEHNDPKGLIDLTEPNDSKDLIEPKEPNDSKDLIEPKEPIELRESIDPIKLKELKESAELKAIIPITRLLIAHQRKNSETRRLFQRQTKSQEIRKINPS